MMPVILFPQGGAIPLKPWRSVAAEAVSLRLTRDLGSTGLSANFPDLYQSALKIEIQFKCDDGVDVFAKL
jgi:hypothetical protein